MWPGLQKLRNQGTAARFVDAGEAIKFLVLAERGEDDVRRDVVVDAQRHRSSRCCSDGWARSDGLASSPGHRSRPLRLWRAVRRGMVAPKLLARPPRRDRC